MVRVALTGGIATGKSYCLARFASLGAATIDADRLAREAVTPGSARSRRSRPASVPPWCSPTARSIGRRSGASCSTIAPARADLEAIIHPEVYRRIGEWLASLPPGTRLALADIPLLFETGHTHDFDRVVVVACNPREQLRRVMSRDGLSERDARARLDHSGRLQRRKRGRTT